MTSEDGKAEGGTMTSKRAVIYVRISRDRVGAGLGVAEQERLCRELADRLNLDVVAVYVDNDLSAYSGRLRPDYARMLGALRNGAADVVIVWHTDRLHRSNTELEDYIAVVEPHGIVTETVKAGPLDLSTPSGRMVARQLCTIARYESEHRAERVSAARLRQARQGKYGGGPRPYGFEEDGVTIRPEEAAEIVRMAYAFLSGVSIRAIAGDLRTREVPTANGMRWQATTVRTVLLRPRNAGLMVHRASKTAPKKGKGSRSNAYSDDDIVGTAPWAPILPEDVWRSVTAKLIDPNRTTTPGPTPKWLGSGIYRCPCGGTLNRGMDTSTGVENYRCYARVKGGGHVYIPVAEADALVRDVVIERLSRDDAAELIAPAHSGPNPAELRAELAIHHERLAEIARDRDDDLITRAQFLAQTAQRRAKADAIQAQLDAAAEVSPLSRLIGAADVARAWDELSLGEKRAALKALMTVNVHRVGPGRRSAPVPAHERMSFTDPEPIPRAA